MWFILIVVVSLVTNLGQGCTLHVSMLCYCDCYPQALVDGVFVIVLFLVCPEFVECVPVCP